MAVEVAFWSVPSRVMPPKVTLAAVTESVPPLMVTVLDSAKTEAAPARRASPGRRRAHRTRAHS